MRIPAARETLLRLQGLLDDVALGDAAVVNTTTLGGAVRELQDQIDLVLAATRGREVDMPTDRPLIARLATLMERVERLSPSPDG